MPEKPLGRKQNKIKHRWSKQANRELKWNTKYKNIETEVKGTKFFP